jgi:DNA-binding CsgD family transcriptional regulator
VGKADASGEADASGDSLKVGESGPAQRLLERERELAAISGSLDRARRGVGSTVLIEGPAGIGKTRLLDAAAELAERGGARVLRARASELESEVPFAIATQLFSTVERPEALAGAGTELPSAVSALAELTADLACGGPLVLSVDDAQWADRPSMAFLSHLAMRPERAGALVVLAIRSGEEPTAPRALAAIRAAPGTTALTPTALSEKAVAELLIDELDCADPAFARACARLTGGNPFLTRELARSLAEERVAPNASSVAHVEQLVPSSVLHSVLTRLGRLGDAARSLATAVAVLGDNSGLRHVIAIAKLGAADAEDAADRLASAGILEPGEPLRFTHPLIANAVRSDLGPFARARAHREAAQLLAADGAPIQEVAAHLLVTRGESEGWVVEALRQAAAHDLAHGDPEASARLLARALEEPPSREQRTELLLELATAEALAGSVEAKSHAQQALAAAHGAQRAQGLRLLSRIELGLGDHAAAARALSEVLGELGPDHPVAQRVLAEYLTVNRFRANLHGDAVAQLKPIVAAARLGSWPTEPGLLAHVALNLALEGEDAATIRAMATTATAEDPLLDRESHGMFMGIIVQALCCVDELELAEKIADEAQSAASRQGAFLAASLASFHRAIPRYHRGQLAAALADVDDALRPVRDGWSSGAAWPQALQAHAQLELGDLIGARSTIAAAAAMPGSMDEPVIAFASARVALAARDPARALAQARAAGDTLARDYDIHNPALLPWRAVAARAAHATGSADVALELASEQLALARELPCGPRGLALALRTVAAVSKGAESVGLLDQAASMLEESPAGLERAHALADLGSALRRAGRRSDAERPLREALQLADGFGAAPVVRHARDELRALGVRPRRAAFRGIDSLTPAEQRVARLAARGLSNPEIARELVVTPRTVQTHLAHTYRKLGISSRHRLAELLAEA